ncbi:MAG TPA: M48 family metallopeptidase [Vicinamibacteria bacterium]|nr:M48 family metallopeptidase [Vicinamibacteria bacterium]
MTAQETGRFWLCPKCGRHVPGRLENCRCGASRADAPSSPAVVPDSPLSSTAEAASDLVYPNENPLFAISLVLSVVFWLLVLVGTLGIALLYALLFFVFYLFAQSALIAHIKGTAVRITPQQFPDLHERLAGCCRRLGIDAVPETYLLHGDGAFNAFATRFLGVNFVVLLSDVVDALESRPGAISFYLGHELAHIHRRHLVWRPVLLPAGILPLLGAAYHRAREATCDNYGAACCDDPQDAAVGLCALAAGGKRWQTMSLPDYVAQARETSGFWMSFNELISDYPWLVKRVARVTARAQGRPADVPARNPLAYLFALFVPRTGAGGGGGLVSLLLVVAVIGIIAAIAIPSLLRARISANEAAAVGDVRTVVSAQAAFQSVAGNYGSLECLAVPSSPGCIAGYPATAPTFVDRSIGSLAAKSGYERAFVPGDTDPTEKSPRGVRTFCYSAFPVTAGQTGVRSFGGDQTGRICFDPRGANLCAGAELPYGCTVLE